MIVEVCYMYSYTRPVLVGAQGGQETTPCYTPPICFERLEFVLSRRSLLASSD